MRTGLKFVILIYDKARDMKIGSPEFWIKLGLLLFDSGYYQESFMSFKKIIEMESPQLRKFLAFTWMGHLKDLQGEREEALNYYKEALEHDTGLPVRHDQYRMRIDRRWIEKRLKKPFTWKK